MAVAVVNPNREDDLSGLGALCAAGVVFMALVQTARLLRIRAPGAEQPDLLSMLDLAEDGLSMTPWDLLEELKRPDKLGLTQEQADRILEEHGDVLEARVEQVMQVLEFIRGKKVKATGKAKKKAKTTI